MLKATLQINLTRYLLSKRLKILYRRHILLAIIIVKKLLEHFTKQKSQKINQTEFKVEKAIKSYNNKVRLKRKGYKNSFNG